METRANYALIGAFVIVAALAVLGFALWLGQSQFQREYDQYDIVFEGPVNLEEGASVRYIGIKVGEVETVRIDRDDASKVRARLRVDRETPVKTDSTASIEFAGITGVTFIQINAGTQTSRRLKDVSSSEVPEIEAKQTQLSELFSSGAEVMGQANMTLEKASEVFSDENLEAFSETLANMEKISAMLAENDGVLANANDAIKTINGAAASFDEASRELTAFSKQANGQLESIGTQATGLIEDVRAVADDVQAGVEDGRRAIVSAAETIEGPATDTITDAKLVVQDLRSLISRLDRLARELEQNPDSLVRGSPQPYEKD